MSAQHSAASCEHGTPEEIIELARHTLGGIDLDPASSERWNKHVGAKRYYCRQNDGLLQPWFGRVFVNPPGRDTTYNTPSLVRKFWSRLVEHWRAGKIDGAIWVGYSLEQLVQLQAEPAHPLQFPTLIPAARLKFNHPAINVASGIAPGKSPTHGNFITLLPSPRARIAAKGQMVRFLDCGESLTVGGAVVRRF